MRKKDNGFFLHEFEIPQCPDIERLLLCEMISFPENILEVRRIVTESMFDSDEAKSVWRVITSKYDNHEHIDMTTIWSGVDRKWYQANIIPYMIKIGGSGAAMREHALILRETFIKRSAYHNVVSTLQMIKSGDDASVILDKFKRFQEEINGEMHEDSTENLCDILNDLADDMQKERSEKVTTGFRELDYYTYGGFNAGNLVILAARPSVGKTTIALQMALAASRVGKKVCLFSLEMTKKELGQRVLLTTGRVQPVQFYSRNIDWEQMELAIKETASGNLFINDSAHTIEDIISKICLLKQEGKCDIAFIDYLGLISLGSSKLSVVQQISEITRKIKQTAKDYEIPIVLLCQLNRASASEGRSPQLFDLRDSGSIEQDADSVLMLERPRDMMEGENLIDMWVRKNRGGKAGDICIHLRGDNYYSNFIEYDK